MIKSPGIAFDSAWQRIPSYIKVTFLSSAVIFLLTHAFVMTNRFLIADDILGLFHPFPRGLARFNNSSGRFFGFFQGEVIRGSAFGMSWVQGMFSCLYLSLSACFVVSCFKIKRKIFCILTAAMMTTFPTVITAMTFISGADGVFLCLLLVCAAAYLANRFKFGFLPAIVLITLSMGIYQAYYPVAASLMLGVLILDLLDKSVEIRHVLIKALKFSAALLGGMLLYFIVVHFAVDTLGAYMGIDQMGQLGQVVQTEQEASAGFLTQWLTGFFYLSARAYHRVAQYFLANPYSLHNNATRIANVVIVATALIILVPLVHKTVNIKRISILLPMLLLLPLSAAFIYVMSPIHVHLLMIYGLVILIIFVIALLDIAEKRDFAFKFYERLSTILGYVAIAALIVVCLNYWRVANQTYFRMHMAYEQSYAFSNRLISRIESVEGYSLNKTVMFVGDPSTNMYTPQEQYLAELNYIVPPLDVNLPGIAQRQIFPIYMQRFLAFKQDMVFVERHILVDLHDYGFEGLSPMHEASFLYDIGILDEIKNMPLYPDYGSVRVIDEWVVVKFDHVY